MSRFTALLALSAVLSGCSQPVDGASEKRELAPNAIGRFGRLYIVEGYQMRCALFEGLNKGGISCVPAAYDGPWERVR